MPPSRKIKPPADLKPRPQDKELSVEQLRTVPRFQPIRQLDQVAGQAGVVVLRHFRKGEVICQENEPGFTAFYILSGEDVRSLPPGLLPGGTPPAAAGGEAGPVASVSRSEPGARPQGLADWLKRALGAGPAAPNPTAQPLKPVMYEGELFGEMSCLYRIPRTATVVAERDCYLIEMLRNVLDKLYGDKAFAQHLDGLYRKRFLELQLRAMPLFRDLSPELYERLRQQVELRECEPGDLICDEHERADAIYLIRSGFVKVVKGASALLEEDGLPDFPALVAALAAAGHEPAGPRRKVWDLLPASARTLLGEPAAGRPPGAEDRKLLLFALNDLLKQPKLYTLLDGKQVPAAAAWEAEAKKLPPSPRKWQQHQPVREFNRRLLAALFPGAVPPYQAGGERTLAFRSVNDPWIGEIGVLLDLPRSATCIAYDHSDEGKLINGRVELVCISRALFEEIRAASPGLGEEVRRVAEGRLRTTRQRLSLPLWHESTPATMSRHFDELGLIQGQKLMLIDLERCTRCDKCVEACVESHTPSWWAGLLPKSWRGPTEDGRSRLFLDGPRFQVQQDGRVKEYLVPSTCRQCKDPVCLVGCPVGSIHKGDNGQIVIEDWCIGCTRCAQQCPYGSIQMHSTGLVPRRSSGWRHRRGESGPWAEGSAPFYLDRTFRGQYPGAAPVVFEHPFRIDAGVAREHRSFQLLLESAAGAAEVEVNGQKVELAQVKGSGQGQEKWTHEATLALGSAAAPAGLLPGEKPPQPVLHAAANVVRVRVTPPETGGGALLLDLGLFAVTRPTVPADVAAEFSQELVLKTAVVCDMCSDQFGQRPACVNACPHEAAMRIPVAPDDFLARLR